jgi:hypothetical protein
MTELITSKIFDVTAALNIVVKVIYKLTLCYISRYYLNKRDLSDINYILERVINTRHSNDIFIKNLHKCTILKQKKAYFNQYTYFMLNCYKQKDDAFHKRLLPFYPDVQLTSIQTLRNRNIFSCFNTNIYKDMHATFYL